MSMLPEINPLPGTQCTSSVCDRQIQVVLRQDASDVRRHVVRPLVDMGEHWVAVGNLSTHESFKVSANGRVCVFTQYQRSAGMAQKDMAQTGMNAGILNDALDFSGEVNGAPPAGADTEFLLTDHRVTFAASSLTSSY